MDFINIIKFLGLVVEGIFITDALPAHLLRDGYEYWSTVFITTLFNALRFAWVMLVTVSRHWVAKVMKHWRAKFLTPVDHNSVVQKSTNNRWYKFVQNITPRWFVKIQTRNGMYKRRILRALKTGGYAMLVIAGTMPYISGIATVFIGLSINRNTWANRKWSIVCGYICIVIGSSLRMMLLTYYPVIDLLGWWEHIRKIF